MGMVGLVMLVLLVLGAIFVPLLSPFEWRATNMPTMWNQPAGTVDPITGDVHWLGTTERGSDLLELLFVSLRTTLVVALPATLLSVLIGSALGAAAGYYGGLFDFVTMRISDLLLAVPALPAYLILGQVLRMYFFQWRAASGTDTMDSFAMPLLSITVIVFTVFGWTGVFRQVRAQVLSLRQQPFVEAAKALGASNRRIIFKHLIPNSMAPILVAAIFLVGEFIISLSILSYIDLTSYEGSTTVNNGTGGQPSLGGILALSYYTGSTWFLLDLNPLQSMRAYTILLPAVLILLIVLSVNYVGDALRYALDPHRQS